MPKLKGILLDLDQTLANTEDYTYPYSKKKKEELNEYKLYEFLLPVLKVISWEEFSSLYVKARKEVRDELYGTAAAHSRYLYIQRTLELCGINFIPDLIQRAVEFYFNTMLTRTTLFPGVLETLKVFKYNNLKTCLVTDFTADMQIRKIRELGITKYIDYMVTSEEAGADKPHIEQAVIALRKMKLNQDEVVMIGNNPKTDIQLAGNLGMDSVLFDYNGDYKKSETGATFYTQDFSKIPEILKIPERKFSRKKLLVLDFVGTLTNETRLTEDVLQTFVHKDPAYISAEYAMFRNGQISEAQLWYKLGVGDIAKARKTIDAAITIRSSVVRMLERLRLKYTLVLLSDFPEEWGQMVFESRGIRKVFDSMIFTSSLGMRKGDDKMYNVFMDKYPTVNPEHVTIVDDNAAILAAGREWLMRTVLVRKADADSSVFIPDDAIEDILELEKVLESKKKLNG